MVTSRTKLSILTAEQESAVKATEGHIRVVAGAGSGKTRNLVYRYAYLLNDMGIPQSDILCMTFTNKAAQEMKARILRSLPRWGRW
ncbi:MAG: UvrD-helicase domain-containing protein [Bacteroidales bacterium]|nr:UvrD-helicase domain-containing protein [Bacteroidales bacterium]